MIAAAIFALIAGGCADSLLLRPSTHRFHDLRAERVCVSTPAGELEIWTRKLGKGPADRPPGAYVLCFTGNASRAEAELDRVEPAWEGRDVELWAMNYPGFGGSAGPSRIAAVPPAAIAAYDAVAARAMGRPIYLWGHSMGTAAALHVAANRPVKAIVLHNPPPLKELLMERYGWWNLWLAARPVADAVPDELDSISNGAKCSMPALFLVAGTDWTIPPEYQQRVIDAYAGPKKVIELRGYSHGDALRGPGLEEAREALNRMTNDEARMTNQ